MPSAIGIGTRMQRLGHCLQGLPRNRTGGADPVFIAAFVQRVRVLSGSTVLLERITETDPAIGTQRCVLPKKEV